MFNRRWSGLVAIGLLATGSEALGAGSNPNSILLPVPCASAPQNPPAPSYAFPQCAGLQGSGGLLYGRIEWYSGATLIYTENGPFAVSNDSNATNTVVLEVDGNHDPIQFASTYENSLTSILAGPDLSFKVYAAPDANRPAVLAATSAYRPLSSALWSKHSEDTVALQTSLNAEISRAMGAEATLQSVMTAQQWDKVTAASNELADTLFYLEDA